MTDIVTPLMHLQDELQKIVSNLEDSFTDKPSGHLRISQSPKGCSYYHYDSSSDDKITATRGKYIRKDNMPLVYSLAQKDYSANILRIAKKQIHSIQKFLEEYSENELENAYTQLHPLRQKLFTPFILPTQMYAQIWQDKSYNRKGFLSTDTSEFFTEKGERVRSKSEIMLANQFKNRNIPYHYEYPLNIPGQYPIHPDFTLLNKRTREEFLWEHLGMMDDEKYASDAVNRIHHLIRNGFIPGKNLILTYETKNRPLSSKVIDIYIDEFLV